MNIPKIDTIEDLVEFLETMDNSSEVEIGFDMSYDADGKDSSHHSCGSACCLGGWVYLANEEKLDETLQFSPNECMRKIFDINPRDAEALAYPPSNSPGWEADPHEAARVVRHYIKTGEVDWVRMRDGLS